MADQAYPDFELLPAGEEDFTPDEELASLTDPDSLPESIDTDTETLPLGRSWLWDFDARRMGARPQPVHGVMAVVMVAQVALRVRRGYHYWIPGDLGMDDPDVLIGQVEDSELIATYQQDMREALLSCHDRITDVTDFVFTHDDDEEVAYVDLTIEIDGDEDVRLEGVPLRT
jgi:hypothetical protein